MKLLVVCLGNICRSPMAEGILRKKITEKNLSIIVDSAGTADYHVGEPPDERAIHTSKKFNVDISRLRGRQFTTKDFDTFDKIYAMDASNYNNIIRLARNEEDKKKVRLFLPEDHTSRDVPDPWYGGLQDFVSVFNLLDEAGEKVLLEILSDNNP
jgi:protein-tyrosine phosphatase